MLSLTTTNDKLKTYLAVRTGLHLGLVAARPALSGQAACLAPLGHPLVPGGDGLAAVVTADKHLRTRDDDIIVMT